MSTKDRNGSRGSEVLVIQPLPGIGDMVWHLGHLRAIAAAAPGGRVDILAKPRSQADRLLAAEPSVQRVLWLERDGGAHDGFAGLFRLAALLRAGTYSSAWILHGSWRYGLAACLAGIPLRVGYGSGLQRLFLNGPILPRAAYGGAHAIERATGLLEANGLAPARDGPPLALLPAARARVQARFGHLPEPWIALGIGSSEPFKQWGRVNFAALAKSLGRVAGQTLFLLGGPAEAAMAGWIERRARDAGAAAESAAALPLEDALALTARCRIYLGNDTGMMNAAVALGVQAIGLFGGSPTLGHSPLIHPLVPVDDGAGMAGISVDQVLSALRGLAPECCPASP